MSTPTFDLGPEIAAARWLREQGHDPERVTTEQIADALNATGCADVFGAPTGSARVVAPGTVQVQSAPLLGLAEQRHREMRAQIARDMLHRPDPQIAADFETLSAALKVERDLLNFKVVRLPDGRLAKRCEDEPDKALVLQRPASLADMLRDFPNFTRSTTP